MNHELERMWLEAVVASTRPAFLRGTQEIKESVSWLGPGRNTEYEATSETHSTSVQTPAVTQLHSCSTTNCMLLLVGFQSFHPKFTLSQSVKGLPAFTKPLTPLSTTQIHMLQRSVNVLSTRASLGLSGNVSHEGVLRFFKHNVSETAFHSAITLIQWPRLALSKGPN